MSEIITSSIEISAGIVFSGLTVDAGGDVTVLSGGTVTDAEAVNYGYFWVEEGGYIGNIRVTNSGDTSKWNVLGYGVDMTWTVIA